METKYFAHFSKQHLEPNKEAMDCCICLNPSDNQTKKCSHPMCLECFYNLTDNKTKNIPCPICRKVLVKRRRTNKKKILNDLHLYQLIQEQVERHPNLPRFIPASFIFERMNVNPEVRTENFSQDIIYIRNG
jgi:DNA-directed RNA polymerase subunit RPC12/RpoP